MSNGPNDVEELVFLLDGLSNKLQALLLLVSMSSDPDALKLGNSIHLLIHAMRGCVHKTLEPEDSPGGRG